MTQKFKNRFEEVEGAYSYATGNDQYPLKVGSKGSRVKKLQEALIKLGANITADGIFGSRTKSALTSAGYSSTIEDEFDYQAVLAKAYPKTTTTKSTIDKLKDAWEKSGAKDAFSEWLKNKQAKGEIPDDVTIPPKEESDKILGMPKPVFYVGAVLVTGLTVFGIVMLARSKKVNTAAVSASAV